jgi:hypothetical protein
MQVTKSINRSKLFHSHISLVPSQTKHIIRMVLSIIHSFHAITILPTQPMTSLSMAQPTHNSSSSPYSIPISCFNPRSSSNRHNYRIGTRLPTPQMVHPLLALLHHPLCTTISRMLLRHSREVIIIINRTREVLTCNHRCSFLV